MFQEWAALVRNGTLWTSTASCTEFSYSLPICFYYQGLWNLKGLGFIPSTRSRSSRGVLVRFVYIWWGLGCLPQEPTTRSKQVHGCPIAKCWQRDAVYWVQRTGPRHGLMPHNIPPLPPPCVALLCQFSSKYSRFLFLLGDFDICWNGAWTWNVSMEFGHALWPQKVHKALVWGAVSLRDNKCAAQGENVLRWSRSRILATWQIPLTQGQSPFWCPDLSYLLLLDPSRVNSLVSEVVLYFYWNIRICIPTYHWGNAFASPFTLLSYWAVFFPLLSSHRGGVKWRKLFYDQTPCDGAI